MSAGLNYYWRLLATGGCFAVFGFGGLALTTVVFPVLFFIPGRTRALRARWVIHKSFRFFMRLMETVGVMRFEVIGAERLHRCRNTLVLANHPTLIDVVALISLMPTASCVVKRALWQNPFLGGVVRAANYISNSEPESLIDDCAADLAAGNPLIIFPEGTRTRPGQPLRFLRGASYIALKSGKPILPVLIDCNPSTLTKRERWYQIPRRRFHLRVEVLEPINAARWIAADDPQAIAARKLTLSLEAHFTQELARHGRTEHPQA
ncbi:MAG: 1-acyl-sn-glycerol-3-phosphate acyltransferase [Candidatus Accumulibacter sp. 66-26]|nr:1-acyl-sn-glycerol-3-phosphate acyltransferase [Accumulibacter sp.]OJW52067.1 MAG: 1-acyl-sn-glycerol-3-phosphate acyltransferase [Candidatus Accumulibacter sp. 66-26]